MWRYIEEHVQRTGVAIETQGFSFVTSGRFGTACFTVGQYLNLFWRRRESLTGNATLHLYPHFKPLQAMPGIARKNPLKLVNFLVSGVVDYLSTEISTSKQKKFPLVTFVDSPGLVDGDMWGYSKNPGTHTHFSSGATHLMWMRLSCGWQNSPTWSSSSSTPLARFIINSKVSFHLFLCGRPCARGPWTLWRRFRRSTRSGCASIWARLMRQAMSPTARGSWCRLFRFCTQFFFRSARTSLIELLRPSVRPGQKPKSPLKPYKSSMPDPSYDILP